MNYYLRAFRKHYSGFLVIAKIEEHLFFKYGINSTTSLLSPLLLKTRTLSVDSIIPRSPWNASLGWTKKLEVPVEDKVAHHFFPIIPLLPTPETMIFPFLQFKIVLIICSNDFPILDCSFLREMHSILITFLILGTPSWSEVAGSGAPRTVYAAGERAPETG